MVGAPDFAHPSFAEPSDESVTASLLRGFDFVLQRSDSHCQRRSRRVLLVEEERVVPNCQVDESRDEDDVHRVEADQQRQRDVDDWEDLQRLQHGANDNERDEAEEPRHRCARSREEERDNRGQKRPGDHAAGGADSAK